MHTVCPHTHDVPVSLSSSFCSHGLVFAPSLWRPGFSQLFDSEDHCLTSLQPLLLPLNLQISCLCFGDHYLHPSQYWVFKSCELLSTHKCHAPVEGSASLRSRTSSNYRFTWRDNAVIFSKFGFLGFVLVYCNQGEIQICDGLFLTPQKHLIIFSFLLLSSFLLPPPSPPETQNL